MEYVFFFFFFFFSSSSSSFLPLPPSFYTSPYTNIPSLPAHSFYAEYISISISISTQLISTPLHRTFVQYA
jgi:hypothetical protein